MQRQTNQWLIPLLLAAGAAVALWFYWSKTSEPDRLPAPVAAPPVEAPAVSAGPAHPIDQVTTPPPQSADLVPLPSLDQSDDYFKLEISTLFGSQVDNMLADSGMIEKIVATIDNLPRPHVAESIRPVGKLSTPFLVDGQDASGEFTISGASYARYDALVTLIGNANLSEVAAVYRRYYPLFQKAYVNLGYPKGYFNDRLVEVIDHLLETPEVAVPVELVRPNVLYQFADPELEGLSGGQKLMLRLGPAHAATMKTRLREFRAMVIRVD